MEKLLDLKNDVWLREDEKKFTPTGFGAQMTLQSIAVCPGGLFEFIYDDGGLFWGTSFWSAGTYWWGQRTPASQGKTPHHFAIWRAVFSNP